MAHQQISNYEKFETAMEAAGLAWWWMELPSGVVFFSPNKTRMIGRDSDDFHHYSQFTEIVHPDDYEKIMKVMQDHIDGKTKLYETNYRIKHANGKYVKFYDRGQIVSKKMGKHISPALFLTRRVILRL